MLKNLQPLRLLRIFKRKIIIYVCLIELINNKDLILISQAKINIQNQKKQITKNIEEQCKQKISLMKNINESIKEQKGLLEQIFANLIGEIDQIKSQTEKQLQQGEIITSDNLEIDLGLLNDKNSNQTIQIISENELLLIKSFLNQTKFCEINNLSKKILEIFTKFYDISKLQNESFNFVVEQKQKTKVTFQLIQEMPFLKFLCENHDEQIFMLQLDEKNKGQKFACSQCIAENQGKQITLDQLQQKYDTYQFQSETSLTYFQQLREQHTRQIIILLNRKPTIQHLEENLKSFQKTININLQFKNQNIFQLEKEQLQDLLQPLYQEQSSEHFYKIIEKQLEQDKELYVKFEQHFEQLIKLEMQNFNLIKHRALVYFEETRILK
ncbi:unnamed protein product [Paramecium sonneborni]|uniref:Uncharacterized protein n=1 Tax=Paramecium sonneborni TaxID=65129 RepID=A0A8S1R2H2_9CILI|nr:unnamed protein product [Paramecium sonneborni]